MHGKDLSASAVAGVDQQLVMPVHLAQSDKGRSS
jgi:hypothetical protein